MASSSGSPPTKRRKSATPTVFSTSVEERWTLHNIFALISSTSVSSTSISDIPHRPFCIGATPNPMDPRTLQAEARLSLDTSNSDINISFSIPNRRVYRDWTVMANVESLDLSYTEGGRRIPGCTRYIGMPDVNLIEGDCACIYFKLNLIVTRPKVLEGPPKSLELYGSEALADFGAMFDDPETYDLIIKVPQRSFYYHKFILSARSPVFKAMFSIGMKEAQDNTVEISDISAETMEHFLSFLYCGQFQDPTWFKSLPELVYVSQMYCVESLKYLCDTNLIRSVTSSNALALAKLASRHELSKAYEDIWKFIRKHKDISVDCIEIVEGGINM